MNGIGLLFLVSAILGLFWLAVIGLCLARDYIEGRDK
jgi:hypothetical protein